MRKWKLRLAFAILLLAVLGGLTWLMVAPHEPSEPVYQGKRLSELLHGLDGSVIDGRKEGALHEIGTNAIPTLLRMLRARDSKFRLKLMELAQKQELIEIHYITAAQRNQEAATGFYFLGAEASNAVPALIQIYEENISEWSQTATADALCYIGSSASAAIPALLQAATNTIANVYVRENAAQALGKIGAKPELVVPALIICLHDSEAGVRISAAGAVVSFKDQARSAIPSLIDLLKDPNKRVRAVATWSLSELDPEAAAKAGIK